MVIPQPKITKFYEYQHEKIQVTVYHFFSESIIVFMDFSFTGHVSYKNPF